MGFISEAKFPELFFHDTNNNTGKVSSGGDARQASPYTTSIE